MNVQYLHAAVWIHPSWLSRPLAALPHGIRISNCTVTPAYQLAVLGMGIPASEDQAGSVSDSAVLLAYLRNIPEDQCLSQVLMAELVYSYLSSAEAPCRTMRRHSTGQCQSHCMYVSICVPTWFLHVDRKRGLTSM